MNSELPLEVISRLKKLEQYESTGLTPDQIIKIDKEFLNKCIEVNELKMRMKNRANNYYRPDIQKAFEDYYGFIDRAGADELLKWLKTTDFFIAPASTKYHGSHEHGLLEHSLNVYQNLKRICDIYIPECSEETIAIVALLHDVCKIGNYVRSEKGYEYAKAVVPLGHSEKSVIMIQKFMMLTEEETVAIMWHMGAFDYRVKGGSSDINRAYDKYPLAAALHIADMMATYLDKEKER